VYGVLFSPLWLKSVPGWPAISLSTSQQFRVGQIVWFGCLSAISQLASRVGEGGGVWQLFLHSVTQPYTTWPRWQEQGGGLRSLPLYVPWRAGTATTLSGLSRLRLMFKAPTQSRIRGGHQFDFLLSKVSMFCGDTMMLFSLDCSLYVHCTLYKYTIHLYRVLHKGSTIALI
jgi:hypothetical protein